MVASTNGRAVQTRASGNDPLPFPCPDRPAPFPRLLEQFVARSQLLFEDAAAYLCRGQPPFYFAAILSAQGRLISPRLG